MKRIYWFIPLLIVSLTVCSCKSSKKTSATDTEVKNEVKQLLYYEEPMDSLTTDYYDIDSMAVEGHMLKVFVSYGGGCGNADFEMYYQPQKILVMPHRTYLFLKFTDNDPCRSIVNKELQFDLSVMDKEAKTGGVILYLGDDKVTYKISGDSKN
jgi:hypothetical protein